MTRDQAAEPRPGAMSLWRVNTALVLLAGLMLWLLFGAVDHHGRHIAQQEILARLWGLGTLVAFVMTNMLRSRRYFFQPDLSSLQLPVLALLLTSAMYSAVGLSQHISLLLVVHLVWITLAWIYQRVTRRLQPPLRLGTLSRLEPKLQERLSQQKLETIQLSAQQPSALQMIDGLIIDTQNSSVLQRRFQEHAQVMNLPILSQRQLNEVMTGKVAVHHLDGDWLRQSAYRTSYHPWKRFFDVAATLLAAPILIPLLIVVATVVYFNSGSPVLFWQERVGQNGVPFQLVKFRTMTRDSERSGPAFAKHGDQRITPIGAFLRKFRLDELPQFYNVLRGEMSIIGPRPEQLAFVVEFEESIPLYGTRHWVRPGITGWAQVHQGYTDSVGQTVEKLQYDFYYVKHCSLLTDLEVVWKTALTILTGFGSR